MALYNNSIKITETRRKEKMTKCVEAATASSSTSAVAATASPTSSAIVATAETTNF